jgi:hypothetical protein
MSAAELKIDILAQIRRLPTKVSNHKAKSATWQEQAAAALAARAEKAVDGTINVKRPNGHSYSLADAYESLVTFQGKPRDALEIANDPKLYHEWIKEIGLDLGR